MAAANTDLLKKLSRKWVGQIGAAGVSDAVVTTIPLSSTTNLATDTAVVATIDRVDANGTKTPTLEESIIGVVSGSNLVTCTRGVEGTAQAHSAGAVVEILVTAKGYNDIIDHLLVQHGQTGSHTSALVTTLKASGAEINTGTEDAKIVTPKAIADSYLANDYNSLYRQALINGNFDVWQRGTSGSVVDNTVVFYADRWLEYVTKDGGTLPTLTRSREVEADDNGSFFYSKLAFNGAGTSLGANSFHTYQERIENGTRNLCGDGKKVTVSFWAKSDVANKKIGVLLTQNYGTGGSPTTEENINGTNWTLTSTWTKYTYTFTTNTLVGKTFGTSYNDYLELAFYNMWGSNKAVKVGAGTTAETYVGSGYIGIKKVQLCAGDVALPFIPKSFEEEYLACLRYCYVPNCSSTYSSTGALGSAFSAVDCLLNLRLPVPMRTLPTLAATASEWALSDRSNAPIALTAIGLTTNWQTTDIVTIDCDVASGLTQYRPYVLIANGAANKVMIFSAEL